MMIFFRQQSVRTILIVFLSATMLHMSFCMAEIAALKLMDNKMLVENAKKLTSNFIEEEGDSTENERAIHFLGFDLLDNNFNHDQHESGRVALLFRIHRQIGGPSSGHSDTFSPPPDATFLI